MRIIAELWWVDGRVINGGALCFLIPTPWSSMPAAGRWVSTTPQGLGLDPVGETKT